MESKNDNWIQSATAMTQNNYSYGWQYIWNWLLGDSDNSKSIDSKTTQSSKASDSGENRLDKIYKNDPNQVSDLIIKSLSHAQRPSTKDCWLKLSTKDRLLNMTKRPLNADGNEMAVVMEDEVYALVMTEKQAIANVLPLLEYEDPWIQIKRNIYFRRDRI